MVIQQVDNAVMDVQNNQWYLKKSKHREIVRNKKQIASDNIGDPNSSHRYHMA
jgi:hypothetical protein